MWDVIRGLVREGTTLLLTTQYLEEADELADTIAVVDHGKIIARGTADELKSQVGGERIEVDRPPPRRHRQRRPRSWPRAAAARSTLDEHTRELTVPPRAARRRWSRSCATSTTPASPIDDIGLRRPTLDDVFLALTGHAAEDEADDETGASASPTTGGRHDRARRPRRRSAAARASPARRTTACSSAGAT